MTHPWHPHESADIVRQAIQSHLDTGHPLPGTAALLALGAVLPRTSRLVDAIETLLASADPRVEPAALSLALLAAACGPKALDEALSFRLGSRTPAGLEAWLAVIVALPDPDSLRALFPTYCHDGWTRESQRGA